MDSNALTPRPRAANAVRAVHLALVIFTMVGFALPGRLAWMAHFLLVPATQFHWWTNGGRCALTSWERRLRAETSAQESGSFVRDVVQRLSGWMPPEKLTSWTMTLWMWGTWSISLARLFF